MANPEHLAMLKQGVKKWNEWRRYDFDGRPDLEGVDLSSRWLKKGSHIDQLFLTHLHKVLMGNYAGKAYIGEADLHGINVHNVILDKANLADADLKAADLSVARLYMTNFTRSDLEGANLERATIGSTVFADVDLRNVNNLAKVQHQGSSAISIDTLYKSKGDIPEGFLRGCGVPEDMIAYARSLRGKAIDFYSCFISHSAKDKSFCERLYADLRAKGVRVWLFEEDAKWGETVWSEIDRGIKIYDKLVVVCSESSLQSGPVNREIERALNREDREGRGILFPIRTDDYVFNNWEHERKVDVVRKVVGDFSGWDKDVAKYNKAFDKLLKGLQAGSAKAQAWEVGTQ